MNLEKNCLICGKFYSKRVNLSKTNWEKSKFCSWDCMWQSKSGNKNRLGISHPAWNKGLPGLKGKDSGSWKGSHAGYSAKHKWIESQLGRPTTCEDCGKTDFKPRQIHWSNKNHKYKRILKDWQRLCAQCHINYDKLHGLKK